MTGPEQKVYEDFSSFSRQVKAPGPEASSGRSKFDVPELTHNLNSLLDMTEEEIRRSDRELRMLKDQTEVLKEEKSRLEAKVVEERDEIERMKEVVEIIEQ